MAIMRLVWISPAHGNRIRAKRPDQLVTLCVQLWDDLDTFQNTFSRQDRAPFSGIMTDINPLPSALGRPSFSHQQRHEYRARRLVSAHGPAITAGRRVTPPIRSRSAVDGTAHCRPLWPPANTSRRAARSEPSRAQLQHPNRSRRPATAAVQRTGTQLRAETGRGT